MSSKKLKNCPCCGGEAVVTEAILLFTSPGDVKARITCTNCGLSLEDDYDTAKEKWNVRVENITQLKSEDSTRQSIATIAIGKFPENVEARNG